MSKNTIETETSSPAPAQLDFKRMLELRDWIEEHYGIEQETAEQLLAAGLINVDALAAEKTAYDERIAAAREKTRERLGAELVTNPHFPNLCGDNSCGNIRAHGHGDECTGSCGCQDEAGQL